MTSIFTATPDLTPYKKIEPKIALDEIESSAESAERPASAVARQSAAMNWSEPDDPPQKVLNQILSWDAKGYDKPYPRP